MNKQKYTLSKLAQSLKQSGIRSASARCTAIGGINLGQAICDIPAHEKIKHAAADAIFANKNLYATHEGVIELRNALTKKIHSFNKVDADPKEEIFISHGATGAYVSAAMTLFNPGDEVILFEPFYGYHKHIMELFGVNIVSVPINPSTFAIDFTLLRQAITPKTRGIVVCTPCNPSGKVFLQDELIAIGDLANEFNLYIITDEIYEYITYPGFHHISIASLKDYGKRTVTISGFSKTYNITGWRLGYVYGPAEIVNKMSLVHDYLYVCPPTPLQYAMVDALKLPEDYYEGMRKEFLHKRDYMVKELRAMGFKVTVPQGAYYLMADFSDLPWKDDEEAADVILNSAKVALVPGRSFYQNKERAKHLLRFNYAVGEDKLYAALANIKKIL